MHHARQLAAIMFTDIVGYTALMGQDETKALNKLRRFKEELTLKVQEFEGKIIQYYGDGCLIIFPNAVDAVSCAKVLQEEFTKDLQVPVRIGIHLGDILLEEGNIFGDCVNISSRIESMGIPGAVLLSDAIKNQIKNKPEFQLTSLGQFEFKNVDEPMEIFALSNAGFPVPEKSKLIGKFKEIKTKNLVDDFPIEKKKLKRRVRFFILLGAVSMLLTGYFIFNNLYPIQKKATESNLDEITDKSIAVLSFTDLSPGKDQEFLADGIAKNIINSLYGIKDLKVIGNTSSFSFKGKNETMQIIGETLGVANILIGSVQKEGKMTRVIAQLMRATDGSQLWSKKYDKDSANIFQLQDDITFDVVMQLKLKLLIKKTIAASSSTNPEVFYLNLNGDFFSDKRNKENLDKALDFYLKALAIDSLNARSWAGVAKCYTLQSTWGWIDRNQGYKKAREAAFKSIELDSTQAEGYRVLGMLKMNDFDWGGAETEYQKALNLEPGNPEVMRITGYLYRCTGRFDEGIRFLKQSITLDPLKPITYVNLGLLQLWANYLEDAIVSFKKVSELNPQFPRAHLLLGEVYLTKGKPEMALTEMLQETDSVVKYFGVALAYQALGHSKKADEILKERTSPLQNNFTYRMARFLAFRGDKDKAFEWVEKAYIEKDNLLIFFKGDPLLKNLKGDPRYIAFLKKMNLPID